MPDATLSHIGGVEVDFTLYFEGSWNARCNSFTHWKGRGRFYLVFLRSVECKMQPFHTLEGLRSILLNLFEVCGMAGATPITL